MDIFTRFGVTRLGFNALASITPARGTYSYGIIIRDLRGSLVAELEATDLYTCSETGRSHTGFFNDRIGGSAPIYRPSVIEILTDGNRYTWMAFVIIDGTRYNSPSQSFVFTKP
jgi:hypothetical protein